MTPNFIIGHEGVGVVEEVLHIWVIINNIYIFI